MKLKVLNILPYKIIILLFTTFLFLLSNGFVLGQNTSKDTVSLVKVKKHSPKLASICSAILPGSGQVYNKKIWKVPIIYISLGTLLYYFDYNNKQYKFYKEAAFNKDTLHFGGGNLSGSGLIYYRDVYRRYRDLNAIGIIVVYVLNIVDANVDANLFDFDVSDDLTFRLEPTVQHFVFNKNNALGLTCKINF